MTISGSIGPTLVGKQIVLGVTGSIAAYKAIALLGPCSVKEQGCRS